MFSREERSGLWITIGGGGALLLALLFWLGFFADAPERTPTVTAPPHLALGGVRGRVVAADDGCGLALRKVSVEGVAGRSDHRVLPPHAAAPGAFEVRALPTGRCTLRLAADGYVDQQRDIVVVAGSTLELPPIALLPLVTLSGRVVDANLTPVAADTVAVTASSGAERRSAAVDGHGHFEFAGLPPGEWTLDAATADPAAPARDSTLRPLTLAAQRGGPIATSNSASSRSSNSPARSAGRSAHRHRARWRSPAASWRWRATAISGSSACAPAPDGRRSATATASGTSASSGCRRRRSSGACQNPPRSRP